MGRHTQEQRGLRKHHSGEVGRLEWGTDPILLFLPGREKLVADTLERLPLPFPGGQENLPGQHLEWGNCPESSLAYVHTCEGSPFNHSPRSAAADAGSPITTKPTWVMDIQPKSVDT